MRHESSSQGHKYPLDALGGGISTIRVRVRVSENDTSFFRCTPRDELSFRFKDASFH